VKDSKDKRTLIEELSKAEGVLFAEEHANWTTFDTRYTEQWWLNNTGQYGGLSDADIDAPEAWQITQGSSNIKVGIIDTGVETNHDDLVGKSTGDLPEGYFNYGHGTHVAGIVGAKVGGGLVLGVSPNTSIVSRKVFNGVDYYGRPLWGGDNNAYNKIMQAVNDNCSILNHSYGGSSYSTTLRIAFANVYKYNRTNTVSMGNSNSSNPSYPAAFGQGIIAVGATDNLDLRSQDNTPGYGWGSNFGNHIDVTAPGGKYAFINDRNILSTWTGNSYLKVSGTSMAAPVVAGIASLIKAYNLNLYNDDIEQIIRISADDKGDPGWDQYYGTGRVNAYKALRFLQAPYQLTHLSASGGTDYSSTNHYQQVFFGTPGLADAVYIVKRHEVRKNVSFPAHFDHNVWGRGVGSNGFSAANPNFGMGYCDVVEGSVSSNGATLRTYVYEVWSISGSWIGWVPVTPQNVSFNYTVLGKPLVAPMIASFTQNPVPIYKGTSGYVDVNLSQGNGTINYSWISEDQPSYITISAQGDRWHITYLNTKTGDDPKAPVWTFGCTVSDPNFPGWSHTQYFNPSLNSDPNGCPTLAFEQNGVLLNENPLLITSLSNPGVDITDFYLINTPLTPVNNRINLTIHEPQTEHTWLDNVELIETRVSDDEQIAVSNDGKVINYRGIIPASIILNRETDITEQLNAIDSMSVSLKLGDVITISLNTENIEDDGDAVIAGEEGPIATKRIPAMTMKINSETNTEVKDERISEKEIPIEFFLRPNKSIVSRKIPNLNKGNIEITINKELTIDYFVFVTNLLTARTRTLSLQSATHNVSGDIITALNNTDQNYAEIYPSEQINLSFQAGIIPGRKAYILKTTGRYETDTASVGRNSNLAKQNETVIPTENMLYDNYPNPFNPTTIIKYALKDDAVVSLKVFNTLGEEIKTLVNEMKTSGYYQIEFDASGLASGIYIYRLHAGDFVSTKKMLMIK
jgi:hypothetical protein